MYGRLTFSDMRDILPAPQRGVQLYGSSHSDLYGSSHSDLYGEAGSELYGSSHSNFVEAPPNAALNTSDTFIGIYLNLRKYTVKCLNI